MGGFAGVLRLDGSPFDPSIEPILAAMGAAIAHRGVEPASRLRDGPLAIIGARRGADGRTLAHDGRASAARVAAALHEHGADAIRGLPGPCALVVWDPASGTLNLSRDRAGLRPLFTARVGSTLLFGSEIKALLAHPDCPRAVDWLAGLVCTAMPRRTHARTSFFHGIDSLEPGTTLSASTRTGLVRTQVNGRTAPLPPEACADDTRTDAEIIAGYRERLVAAVERSLDGDAARTGLLLSGGIDSVSIAAIARRRADIPTYTVLGQSTFGNGDAGLAHRAATTLGLPFHPVLFRWEEPIGADAWRRLVWLTETPLCGPQHYYKFHLHHHAAATRPDLAGMLTGEGSDEYIGADFRNQSEDSDGGDYAAYIADLAEKQREDLHTVETLAVDAWMGRTVFTRPFLASRSGRALPADPWHRRVAYVGPGLEQEVLWRDDRLAAGVGLASDAPFVDDELLDYVTRIPPRAYAPLFWKKHILREAMKGLVPDALRHAPKIPFFGGVDARYTSRLFYDLLVANDNALVRRALGDGSHPVLADGLVDALLADCARDPRRGAATVLLQLVNLGLLEEMARDAAARPGPASAIEVLPALPTWDEAAIAAKLAGDRPALGPALVVTFAPGVELVRRDTVHLDAPSYVMVADTLKYVLDGEETRVWREVLRRLDGERTLGVILEELGVAFEAIRTSLEEAVAFDVVVCVPGA